MGMDKLENKKIGVFGHQSFFARESLLDHKKKRKFSLSHLLETTICRKLGLVSINLCAPKITLGVNSLTCAVIID